MKNRLLPLLSAAVLVAGSAVVLASSADAATSCSSVDVSFARGTGEQQGLGSVGGPFVKSLTSDLSGRSVSSYAVNYAANSSQSSAGPGSKDLVNHVTSVAASCPGTVFVLGGYSQGATVVDNAIGLRTSSSSSGAVLPTSLAARVKALVVFGNPLGIQGQTIEKSSATYGPKAKSYCNSGDPVCGGGNNFSAHLQYASNGSTTSGATFAASKVKADTVGPVRGSQSRRAVNSPPATRTRSCPFASAGVRTTDPSAPWTTA